MCLRGEDDLRKMDVHQESNPVYDLAERGNSSADEVAQFGISHIVEAHNHVEEEREQRLEKTIH